MRDDDLINAILAAANELDAIRSRGREAFDNDPVVRRACERLVEIIGDMVGNLSEEFQQANPEVRYRGAKGMRNILAHHYLKVRREDIWKAVEESIPTVSDQLRAVALDRNIGDGLESPR